MTADTSPTRTTATAEPGTAERAATPAGTSEPAARRRTPLIVLAAVAAVALALALPLARGADAEAPAALDPATLVPSIGAVDADRFAEQLQPPPAPGTATRLAGPFDDAAAVAALAVEPEGAAGAGAPPAAVGTVQVTRDVSTLLVMELRAGFYDEGGALVATERLVLRQPDFTRAYEAGVTGSQYNGVLPFRIDAPAGTAGVASAVVTLSSLVNE